jgi:hypothetical protein
MRCGLMIALAWSSLAMPLDKVLRAFHNPIAGSRRDAPGSDRPVDEK